MVFSYYKRLSAAQKRIYRASDEVTAIPLKNPGELKPLLIALAEALKQEERAKVEGLCNRLLDQITVRLKIRPVRLKVLAARPSNDYGELHGLYYPAQQGQAPAIQVWMRTAQRKQVIAFRTFLRTVLHEYCHHLDYELLKLADSYHTEGFYKRESSLFHQLISDGVEEDKIKKAVKKLVSNP